MPMPKRPDLGGVAALFMLVGIGLFFWANIAHAERLTTIPASTYTTAEVRSLMRAAYLEGMQQKVEGCANTL